MNHEKDWRTTGAAVFRRTREAFGGLSNMAGGYPIRIRDIEFRTSEALYQACRFPHLPEVQRMIIAERSPMAAKFVARRHDADTRPDWMAIRTEVMLWTLRVKLVQNPSFGDLLRSAGDMPIVEYSSKDAFWGATPSGSDEAHNTILRGENVLGMLLMALRDEDPTDVVCPPQIPEFRLLGDLVPAICRPGTSCEPECGWMG